eukprot:274749-Ditylum_brightwellii.AAC.1
MKTSSSSSGACGKAHYFERLILRLGLAECEEIYVVQVNAAESHDRKQRCVRQTHKVLDHKWISALP